MKRIIVKTIEEAIIPYEIWNKIDDISPETENIIVPMVHSNILYEAGYKNVAKDCYYTARITRNGNLQLRRMTMHPQTKENYDKGHKRYGINEY